MNQVELTLLRKAAELPATKSQMEKYLRLRRLIPNLNATGNLEFKNAYSRFYAINAAGLSNDWKDQYFELLFTFLIRLPSNPYHTALNALEKFPRLRGDNPPQFSFVSKLVATCDESRPLYDKFVRAYFGVVPPSVGPTEFRINGFVEQLTKIKKRYEHWAAHKPFASILDELREQLSGLAECHPSRICDLLVWSVGSQKIEA